MFAALKSLVLGFCVALSLGAGALAQAPKAPIVAAAADLKFALDDIAAKFKADTGQEVKLTYGSSGIGQSPHLTMAWLLQLTGLKMVHVPFRGA